MSIKIENIGNFVSINDGDILHPINDFKPEVNTFTNTVKFLSVEKDREIINGNFVFTDIQKGDLSFLTDLTSFLTYIQDFSSSVNLTGGGGGGGDASAANQTLQINELQAINTELDAHSITLSNLFTELQAKADLSETQPVSLASAPLPTGAATETKQDTGNASLSSIDTKISSLQTELEAKADLTETQPVSLETTERTPTLIRATDATGSPIAAGKRSISVYNAGGANGTILGTTIKKGESITFEAGGEEDTLAAFSYDGTGTELVIITIS